MFKPYMDVETGKMVYVDPNPKGKKAEKEASDKKGIHIDSGLYVDILTLAKADGFEPDADTAKGQLAQETRQVQAYVEIAIKRLLGQRNNPEEAKR